MARSVWFVDRSRKTVRKKGNEQHIETKPKTKEIDKEFTESSR